jgi:hypothetical protein
MINGDREQTETDIVMIEMLYDIDSKILCTDQLLMKTRQKNRAGA